MTRRLFVVTRRPTDMTDPSAMHQRVEALEDAMDRLLASTDRLLAAIAAADDPEAIKMGLEVAPPVPRATPTQSGASPEDNDGDTGGAAT